MNLSTTKLMAMGLVFCFYTISPAWGAPEGISKEQADAILHELQQIRKLLEAPRTRPQNNAVRSAAPGGKVKLNLGETTFLGNATAPVTLVEFTDYQCPYCKKFHENTFPQIKENFIDTGKLRFISRDLPLSFHSNALKAARAVRCAGDQNKFWELRHMLSLNPDNLSAEGIVSFAQELQLDIPSFEDCLSSEKYHTEVTKDISVARSIGIAGTPGFVLGLTPKDGALEGFAIKGARSYESFATGINKLLAERKKNPNSPSPIK